MIASTMSTLIIIGGTGELGCKTVQAACAKGETAWRGNVIATYHNNPPPFQSPKLNWQSLDCSDHKSVRSLMVSNPSLAAVIYCAVPKHRGSSEKSDGRLRSGIVEDVANCAEAVVLVGGRFIAISTDLVFDGKIAKGEAYNEESKVCAINPYGQCKSEMEKQLLGLCGEVVIARTSLILTFDGKEYGKGVQFVVDCMSGKHGKIELFADELRNMSFSDDLGRALVECAKVEYKRKGIVNMASDEVTNRWELAKLLANRLGMEDGLAKWVSSGLSSKSGLTNRPLNCALCPKLRKELMKTEIVGISKRLS